MLGLKLNHVSKRDILRVKYKKTRKRCKQACVLCAGQCQNLFWETINPRYQVIQKPGAKQILYTNYFRHFSGKESGLARKETKWGRVTHICVGKLNTIGSQNGLSPGRRQAIIWTDAGILLIGPLGTHFSEILIEIHAISFMKMQENVIWKLATVLSPPQCVKYGHTVVHSSLLSN